MWLPGGTLVLCQLAFLVLNVWQCSGHKIFNPLEAIRYDRARVRLEPVSIKASPDSLSRSGESVNVSWSGVQDASGADWIGVYTPPRNNNTIDPSQVAPVKFTNCCRSPTHLKSGSGSLIFKLVNMRGDYIFALFRGDIYTPVLIGFSNVVTFQNPNEPLQGHLALAENNDIRVTWVTRDVGRPQVKYGLQSIEYTSSVNATSDSYGISDMCGPPATTLGFIDPGQIHTAVLKGLSPATRYYYVFGDGSFGWSNEYSFVTPPATSPSATIKVIAYGDMGQAQDDGSTQELAPQLPALDTTKLILNQINDFHLLLHIGDISYARGFAGVWDEFFDMIQPVAAQVPYMVCIGNHERDYPNTNALFNSLDSGGECGIPYERRLPMPIPSHDQPWYGFDYGCAHFVLMSTEHNFGTEKNSVQLSWLDSHLAAVDRSKTPWLIFAGHRPMYVDSTNNDAMTGDVTVAKLLQQYVEPILVKYQVDLVLWGHHHSYQRTCHVQGQECTDKAPVHVIIGMAGQGLSQNIEVIQPAWIKYIDDKHYGYSRFTIDSTTLYFEYIRNDDRNVHDNFTLYKQG